MTSDLRPLDLPELLDRAFSTYRRHIWLFAGIMAPPAIFAICGSMIMQLVNAGNVQALQHGTMSPARVLVPTLIMTFGFSVLYMLFYIVAVGATTVAVSGVYLDRPTSVGHSYREVKGHLGSLLMLMLWIWLRLGLVWIGVIATGIVASIIVAIGSRVVSAILFVLFLGLGFGVVGFMVVRYGVSVPALVLERMKARDSLTRSIDLTEGHRGRVFLVMLCAIVITYAAAILFQGPFMLGAALAGQQTATGIALSLVGAVLGGIAAMFSAPIMVIALAFIYYDLRIRKEAFDLNVMLELPPEQG